jgi:hypothetical protein
VPAKPDEALRRLAESEATLAPHMQAEGERRLRPAQGGRTCMVSDHDPTPLDGRSSFERAGRSTWRYLADGPEVWRVAIGTR